MLVAATGSLWGPGGERGVYKTTDGGKTWKQVLKVDDDTGANDLVMDPTNSQILYASTYQRRRTPCCMNGGGPGSGIWKSTDGGETWTRLKGGVPDGPLGRIALDVYRKRPNILYALIEGPAPPAGGRGGRGAGAGGGRGAGRGGGAGGGAGSFRVAAAAAAARSTRADGPLSLRRRRRDVAEGEQRQPAADVLQPGRHRSERSRRRLSRRRRSAPDARRRQDDRDRRRASRIHDDVHAIWIDPANSNHVLIGNDGGLAVSYDQAKTWVFLPNLPVGLFYHVSFDMATPFNVCGGMQDNYNWCGPSAVRGAAGIANHHWATCRAATASSCCRIRPTTASSTASRRTATWSASIA